MHEIFTQFVHRQENILKRDRATVRKAQSAVKRFDSWCTETGLDPLSIQEWQIEEYLAGAEIAVSTQKVELGYVKAAFDYALLRGLEAPRLDMRRIRMQRVPDKPTRTISTAELRAMKASIKDEPTWALFHVLAYTGLRRDEACSLRWGAVNLKQQTINVIGKGGKERHVPIHPTLGEVLATMRYRLDWPVLAGPYGGSTTHTTTRRFKTFAPEYGFHDFRRTVASSLVLNLVPIPVVNRIMGWTSRGMLERRYFNVADTNLRDAILKIYSDDPI